LVGTAVEVDVDGAVHAYIVMPVGGLEKAGRVKAGSESEEALESDLKRGREGDVWVCLDVDTNLADHVMPWSRM
jgi:hypothetical protein